MTNAQKEIYRAEEIEDLYDEKKVWLEDHCCSWNDIMIDEIGNEYVILGNEDGVEGVYLPTYLQEENIKLGF